MPELKINLSQIEELINQLTDRDKIQLVRKLEVKTLPMRWRTFLHEIDRRRKKHPLSQNQIQEIIEKARQDIHERSSS